MKNIRHLVPQQVLDQSRAFLYARGLEGCEGTALWIGLSAGPDVAITRLLIPEQTCTKSEYGVSVDLTEKAHYTLPDHLGEGERFFVRIHSHPCEAYHSERDDSNPILTHQGALSIVVPDFAQSPLVLTDCAIYRLEHGRGWLELSPDEVELVFEVVA